ncbi:MAG: nickel/cobalt transporter [Alphaproteobacteria bacterium]|nr:nickel/cobalt transporter [Alphaproteobacteria bacterium]
MPVARRNLLVAAAVPVLAAGLALPFFALPESGPGFWSGLMLEIQTVQRDLHRQLAAAMQAVQAEGAAAAWALAVLSFLYGVFHAAGPGHGKVVMSTYLLTQESHLRRGVALSLVASLAQGATAILIVEATVGLLGLTFRRADATASAFEAASYGLVALVGAILVVTRARRLHARLKQVPVVSDHEPRHGHDHQHGHDEACSHCGHAHGPTRSDVEGPVSVRTLVGLILSIGIRPCSGAVIVLLAAHAMGLRWAGVGAVLAMSLGTGLTVSLLAALSVYARKASLRLAAILPDRATRIATAIDVVGVAGGVVILVAGAVLLQSAWVTPAHPLLR